MLMRRLFFSKLVWSLGLALLATLVLVGINEAGYRQSSKALAEISQAQEARFAVNALLQDVLDAETGQRGYLLTGEARYREPYDSAIKDIGVHLARLRILYANRPAEQIHLSQLADHLSR